MSHSVVSTNPPTSSPSHGENASSSTTHEPSEPRHGPRSAVAHALAHAAHLLPDQAPLEMFVHHNTLHAFQHLPFHDGLRAGAAFFEADVYRAEEDFRRDLARGRLLDADLQDELERFLRRRGRDGEERVGGLCTRRALCMLALRFDLRPLPRGALRWRIREQGFDRRLSQIPPAAAADLVEAGRHHLAALVSTEHPSALADRLLGRRASAAQMIERYGVELSPPAILAALARDPEPLVAGATWQTCRRLARARRPRPAHEPARLGTHRDAVLARTGVDVWAWIQADLCRWAAAYLDEGFAYWPMPTRRAGFFAGVGELLAQGGAPVHPWARRLTALMRDARSRRVGAEDVIAEVMAALGVGPDELDAYLLAVLRTTPGFAGMFSRLERHPHERSPSAPPTSLADFCAVRLLMEQAALEHVAVERRLGSLTALDRSIAATAVAGHPDADAAYRLFAIGQHLGVDLQTLDALDAAAASELLDALDEFDAFERGHVFLEAYERRYREQILDGMRHVRPADPARRATAVTAQYVTCIDDREESFRRHLEEVDPHCETFGAAGSFGLAIDYRGLDAGAPITLAPAGVRPRHEIVEEPRPEDEVLGRARRARRRRWGAVLHQTFFGSRGGVRGALASLMVGPLAWLPLAVRVLAPRSSMRVWGGVAELALPSPRTQLCNIEAAGPTRRGLAAGYGFDEQVDRVYALLEGMGLTRGFAPLVLLLAHGSTSLNNPHEAAHDCGACGGRRGGATARLLAGFANDSRVRAGVRARGISIPDGTWFLSGEHDTSDDRVDLYDAELVPDTHRRELERALHVLDQARARNGHERARKFEKAALGAPIEHGLRHVEGRASHLGEPRPEYGHCTNSICIVGRRSLTRGLFLDRRAFLVSYDPQADTGGRVLQRLLAIAAPVGGGINLEYYFSIVDPERFGCGTKLPHNLCGYLGVLNGTSGDLRTGLPLQMTEIHEPMRLLVIVEATPDTLLGIAAREPLVAELVTNAWIQLVSVDPEDGRMQVFADGGFVPYAHAMEALPSARTSIEYYRDSREFLPPARIRAAVEDDAS